MHIRPVTQVGGHLLLVTPWLFEDYRAGFFLFSGGDMHIRPETQVGGHLLLFTFV
jgi:hypothetical protein